MLNNWRANQQILKTNFNCFKLLIYYYMFQLPGSNSSSSDSIDVDYMNIPDFYLPRDYNSSFSRPILRNSSYFLLN
jgi:hypothetical protein